MVKIIDHIGFLVTKSVIDRQQWAWCPVQVFVHIILLLTCNADADEQHNEDGGATHATCEQYIVTDH